MHSLRRRAGGARRRATAEHNPDDDATRVSSFSADITEACIDLIDLPLDIGAQKRVVELLLHDAPEAEQALARLHAAAVHR